MPVRVDEDRAIAVAVEGDADAAAALDAPPREVLRMRRSAIEIDVAAVGRRAQHLEVEPELLNSRGATVVVAPLAVSIAIFRRPSRCGSGNASRACAM